MRPIDADALKKRILEERDKIPLTVPAATYELVKEKANVHGNAMRGGIRVALRCMEQTPTIEAKPVVRCKDCKHRYDIEHCPMCQEHDYRDEDGDCDYYTVDRTTDNGFCHLAERMEEHAAD